MPTERRSSSSEDNRLGDLLERLISAQQESNDHIRELQEKAAAREQLLQDQLTELRNASGTSGFSSGKKNLQLINAGKPFHTFLKPCPLDFRERQDWIAESRNALASMDIGVVWQEQQQQTLVCVPSSSSFSQEHERVERNFFVDCVVPYSLFLAPQAAGSDLCMQLQDIGGGSYAVPIPESVVQKGSSVIYHALPLTFPPEVKLLCRQVKDGDGIGLVARLRQQNDNVLQDQLQLLRDRFAAIKCSLITDYVSASGTLMQLFGDWDNAVESGCVKASDSLSEDRKKEMFAEKFRKHLDVDLDRLSHPGWSI